LLARTVTHHSHTFWEDTVLKSPEEVTAINSAFTSYLTSRWGRWSGSYHEEHIPTPLPVAQISLSQPGEGRCRRTRDRSITPFLALCFVAKASRSGV